MLSADMQRIDQDDAFLTRGSFYRKRKMLEYARFVDMKWYVSKWYLSGAVEYRYDKNYYEIPMFQKDIRHVVRVDRTGSPGNDIDWGMVDYIAKSLTRMTLFIQRLRELIRL